MAVGCGCSGTAATWVHTVSLNAGAPALGTRPPCPGRVPPPGRLWGAAHSLGPRAVRTRGCGEAQAVPLTLLPSPPKKYKEPTLATCHAARSAQGDPGKLCSPRTILQTPPRCAASPGGWSPQPRPPRVLLQWALCLQSNRLVSKIQRDSSPRT